jgi:hypothetical protein
MLPPSPSRLGELNLMPSRGRGDFVSDRSPTASPGVGINRHSTTRLYRASAATYVDARSCRDRAQLTPANVEPPQNPPTAWPRSNPDVIHPAKTSRVDPRAARMSARPWRPMAPWPKAPAPCTRRAAPALNSFQHSRPSGVLEGAPIPPLDWSRVSILQPLQRA